MSQETRTIPSSEVLPYTFKDDELMELGKRLARETRNLDQMEDDKKGVVSQLKAGIDSKKAEVNLISNLLTSGVEYRKTDCTTTMNDPAPGIKTVRRNDTDEVVRCIQMSDYEKQLQLNFEESTNETLATEEKNNVLSEAGDNLPDDDTKTFSGTETKIAN